MQVKIQMKQYAKKPIARAMVSTVPSPVITSHQKFDRPDIEAQPEGAAKLGHDFSSVRVHSDAQADALNRQLSAQASTSGRDIFLRSGKLQTPRIASAPSTVIQLQPNREERERIRKMEEAARQARAYHATRNANLGGILNQGLQPRHGGQGGAGQAVQDRTFIEHSRNKVHYTMDKGVAEFYQNDVLGGPKQSEILKLSLPRGIRERSEDDPDSAPEMASYRTNMAIPPENIRTTSPINLPQTRSRGAIRRPWRQSEAAKHQKRGDAELQALMSYIPEYMGRDVSDLSEEDKTKLYMIRNAVRAEKDTPLD